MKKSRFYQLDFLVQTTLLVSFFICLFFGEYKALNCLLFCQLTLGTWQLLSSAVWGLVLAEYQRSQFFFVAVLTLAGMSVLMSLPEFQNSELLLLFGNFGVIVFIAAYYLQSFKDLNTGLTEGHLV